MTEQVINVDALPAFIMNTFRVKTVLVRENNDIMTIMPVTQKPDCTIGLRGLLAGYPELSVEKFLERKHADKELDL